MTTNEGAMPSQDEVLKLAVQAGAKIFKNDAIVIADNACSGNGNDFVPMFAELCYQAGIARGRELQREEDAALFDVIQDQLGGNIECMASAVADIIRNNTGG